MSVPSSLYDVKRRIDRFLWEDESLPTTRLRKIIDTKFGDFENVAIVGGLARDFTRRSPMSFKSDIDLVIDDSSYYVDRLAERLGASQNRFGGYSYQNPFWKIDFWALRKTWAATSGHVAVHSIKDVLRCTFFDYDAIIYDVWARKVHASPNYLSKIRGRNIDINLLPNPSINGNLLRATRRILLWNLQPGDMLRSFIEMNLTRESMVAIAEVEKKLYNNLVISNFDDHISLLREVNYRSGRRIIDPSHGIQLELPLSM